MNKISIVVPIYNLEQYVSKCIESIVRQSYSNLEIILVNDGSQDNSLGICKKYAKNNSNIIVVDKQNGGEISARQEGFKYATGKYIMFIDGDDWIEQNTIQKLYDSISKDEIPIVRCCYKKDYGTRTEENFYNLNQPEVWEKPKIFKKLLTTYDLNSVWNNLVQKDLITNDMFEYAQGITYGGDLLFNLKLYEKVNKIKIINESLYHYRINPDSITRKKDYTTIIKNVNSCYLVYYELYKFIEGTEINNKNGYLSLAMSKFIREISEIIKKRLYDIELSKEMKDERKRFVRELLNRQAFQVIRDGITVEELLKNNAEDQKLRSLIYQNKIEELDDLLTAVGRE